MRVSLGTVDGIEWELNKENGCITPRKSGDANVISWTKFWIGNPPTLPTQLVLFVELCQRGVALGHLRRVDVFAVVYN